MEEDLRETTKQFLNNLKENNSKPENIYDYNTFVPNRYLIPLYNAVDDLINKYKEQEKIIELIIDELNGYAYDEYSDCYGYREPGMELSTCSGDCKNCILDYFKKKAKGE